MAQQDIALSNLPAKAAVAITANDQVMLFNATETTQTPFNEAVAQANGLNEWLCVKTKTLNIPSAQVLTLYPTPVQFGITVPAEYNIMVLGAQLYIDFNSVSYAGNTTLEVGNATNMNALYTSDLALTGGSELRPMEVQLGTVAYVATDISVYISGTPATTGDSDIAVTIIYALVRSF